jgi:hypothetical protein
MPAPDISGPQQIVAVTTPDTLDPPDQVVNRLDGYIAIDPNNPNHLVGVCRKFYGPGINYQDVLEAQYSFDGGNTWNTVDLATGNQLYSVSDPWVGIAQDGTVYVIGLAVVTTNNQGGAAEAATAKGNGVLSYSSSDGGKTWSQPVEIVANVAGFGCDNTFGGIDPNTSRVYAIWFDGSLALAFSDDQGQTWQASPSAKPHYTNFDLGNNQFNFVNMSVGEDSAVHIIGMNADPMSLLFYARSLDSAATFEWGQIAGPQIGVGDINGILAGLQPNNPFPTELAVVNPPAILAVNSFPAPAVYAAWSVDIGANAPTMRICIASSLNNGQTWIANLSNNTAPEAAPFLPLGALPQTNSDQYFRPRLCAGPPGTLGCAFSHCSIQPIGFRPSPYLPPEMVDVLVLNTCLAVSAPTEVFAWPRPGRYIQFFLPGKTTAVHASDNSFLDTTLSWVNPVFRYGNSSAYFIGDFIGLCASPTAFFPYWSDLTGGGWQLAVGILSLGQ